MERNSDPAKLRRDEARGTRNSPCIDGAEWNSPYHEGSRRLQNQAEDSSSDVSNIAQTAGLPENKLSAQVLASCGDGKLPTREIFIR
jgi:hypothetical protein